MIFDASPENVWNLLLVNIPTAAAVIYVVKLNQNYNERREAAAAVAIESQRKDFREQLREVAGSMANTTERLERAITDGNARMERALTEVVQAERQKSEAIVQLVTKLDAANCPAINRGSQHQ